MEWHTFVALDAVCLSCQMSTPTAADIAPARAFVCSGSPFSHRTGCTFPLLDDLGFLSDTEAVEQILLRSMDTDD